MGHRGITEYYSGDGKLQGLYCFNLWVHEKYRKKGIATRLHLESAKLATERGLDRILFDVSINNVNAIKTYEKAAKILNAQL